MADKILIVDDDRGLTRALAVRLRHAGFEVHVANDGQEGTALVQRQRPSAIVLDIDMPHFSGPEFHECLQLAARTRSIPVVYLSGHDSALYRRLAFEQGARAFVSKPYETAYLVQLLREVVSEQAAANA
ncbi:MAG TPA: response regulator [Phycisphaerae bacterium]|nr:response regulator [Phycisphaerales bacterium]HRX86402.1 response regulator [Phycisphaerae bacterium]